MLNNLYEKSLLGAIVFLIAIIIMLCIAIYFMNRTNDNLQNKLDSCKQEKVVAEANNITLKHTIETQNKTIETQRISYQKNIKEYEKKLKIKPKIVEVKSNDCKDIKDTINTSIDFINNGML